MIFILALISFIPRILLGFFITNLIWRTVEANYFLIKVFLTFIIGFGVSSLIAFVWIWLGFPLALYVNIEILFVLVCSLYLIATCYKDFCTKYIYNLIKEFNKKRVVFFIGCSFTFIWLLIVKGQENPHGGFDAWYNWNVVSRFIYRGGNEWQSTFLRIMSHPDYPFFVPISNATTWVYIQEESFFAPIAFHLVLSLFAVGLLFSLINTFKNIKQATLACIFFIAQPVAISGMSQYADFPLAYMILASGGLTFLYLETKEKPLAVFVGFIVGLAAWTKNEGFVTIISSTLIWIYIGWSYSRLAFRNYILGLAFPLSVVILFKIFLATPNDILSGWQAVLDKVFDFERYILIAQEFGKELWNISGADISTIGFLIIYALIIGKTNEKKPLWIICFIIIFQLAAYFVIYLVTPQDLEWHLRTSLSRLYLHVYLLFLFLVFIWLKSPDEIMIRKAN